MTVGYFQSRPMRCLACGETFNGEIANHVPFSVALASMRAVHCPSCNANWQKIVIVTKKSEP